jgi:hypothetical protein
MGYAKRQSSRQSRKPSSVRAALLSAQRLAGWVQRQSSRQQLWYTHCFKLHLLLLLSAAKALRHCHTPALLLSSGPRRKCACARSRGLPTDPASRMAGRYNVFPHPMILGQVIEPPASHPPDLAALPWFEWKPSTSIARAVQAQDPCVGWLRSQALSRSVPWCRSHCVCPVPSETKSMQPRGSTHGLRRC